MYRKDSRPELEGLAGGIAIASDQPLTLFVQVSWLE